MKTECTCKPWKRCQKHEAESLVECERLHAQAQDDYYRTQRHDPQRVRFRNVGDAEGLV